jgi:hypothetical protein
VNREDAATLVAVEVFQRAPDSPVSFALVHQTIAALRRHEPGCVCGTCTAARKAKPEHVWRIASRWAGEIASTRARARR